MNREPRIDNFTLVTPSRKKLRAGDVFAMHYDWLDGYVLGRVIKPNAAPRGENDLLSDSTLIYVYSGVRSTKDVPEADHFLTSNLLTPPMFVDRSPWTVAGVETIGNVELGDGQVLRPHCFLRQPMRTSPKTYWDGEGNQLDGPIEPVGRLALANLRSIDLSVSRAMGLPEPTAFHHRSAPPAEAVRLVEDPDGGWVSATLSVTAPEVMELGQRINDRFEEAYMNGYNWEAVVIRYLREVDPDLSRELAFDAEASMMTASLVHSEQSVARMRAVESHLRAMLADGDALIEFIEQHRTEIEWD